MGNLTIRDVDDDLIAKLKRRAKANERSMEGEVRAVLRVVLDGKISFAPGAPMIVKSSDLDKVDWDEVDRRVEAFDWDALSARIRGKLGEAGTPATAVEDIRAFRDGRD